MPAPVCATLALITILAAIATAAPSALPQARHLGAATPPQLAASDFDLSSVKLHPDSAFARARDRNLAYMLSLDSSQLTCIFTSAANLTRCSASNCPSRGSNATAPACAPLPGEMGLGAYYGHYLGHWLSATALMFRSTGDPAVKAKAQGVIETLSDCQEAWKHRYPDQAGYLFPYDPLVFLDMLLVNANSQPVYSVPFYTLHKIMAGLLDQYQLLGSDLALAMLCELAGWVARTVANTVARGGQPLWQRVLGIEWGGMNEVLYNLYNLTEDASFLETAQLFNHFQWTGPLAAGLDNLDGSHGNDGGNHANTHIPEVIGSARGFELTGNATQQRITENFFRFVTTTHAWATGGSNDYEHWGPPMRLGDQLNDQTEESCTQYNMLKLARHLFLWSSDSVYADYTERALLNGIMGNQNQLDPDMTSFIYMLPLGGSGLHKPWGKSNSGFPCCWGTLTEQFSKLGDSIYFRSTDPSDLRIFVNLFAASTLALPGGGLLNQTTTFPVNSSTQLDVIGTHVAMTLSVRVPAWSNADHNSLAVNGQPVRVTLPPGTYYNHTIVANQQVRLVFKFPMSFWASPLADDRPEFQNTTAWMYGPLVLAGLIETTAFVPDGASSSPETFITRTDPGKLAFKARGTVDESPITMQMLPLLDIMDEAYTVYFNSLPPSPVPYSPSGSPVPCSSAVDFAFFNGSSLVSSREAQHVDVRSGNIHDNTTVLFLHEIPVTGHTVDRITLRYRYVAGYTPKPTAQVPGPTFSLALIEARTKTPVATIYNSPILDKYSFDNFTGYSPPITVNLGSLGIKNSVPLLLRLSFVNNDRNLQLLLGDDVLGLDLQIHWL
eukprot:m.69452 g.69452  ORF g.69452 m.69452 type:complete len:836 (-) comp7818_c0_seq2:170-2677(-)